MIVLKNLDPIHWGLWVTGNKKEAGSPVRKLKELSRM